MIFYFSATGNSLYTAQKLADTEQTECISITDVMRKNETAEQFTFSLKKEEAVGFVVPIYFCGIPTIVAEFLSKLRIENAQEHYVFLVMTFGAMDGNAASICTIDIYLPMFNIPQKSQMDKILANANSQLDQICNTIHTREENTRYLSHGFGAALSTAIMYPMYENGRKTSKFTINNSCTGCGLCKKNCPCNAINIENGKPVWVKKSCVLCLGCLHRCPTSAIDYGKKTVGKKRLIKIPYSLIVLRS